VKKCANNCAKDIIKALGFFLDYWGKLAVLRIVVKGEVEFSRVARELTT
jgi:hypothetical protein